MDWQICWRTSAWSLHQSMYVFLELALGKQRYCTLFFSLTASNWNSVQEKHTSFPILTFLKSILLVKLSVCLKQMLLNHLLQGWAFSIHGLWSQYMTLRAGFCHLYSTMKAAFSPLSTFFSSSTTNRIVLFLIVAQMKFTQPASQ